MPRRFLLLLAAIAVEGCSSSNGDVATTSLGSDPAWAEVPAELELYEGRALDLPVGFRMADAAKGGVTAIASGKVDVEIEPRAAEDGRWTGTLHLRPGYGLDDGAITLVVSDGATSKEIAIPFRSHRLAWKKPLAWAAGSGPAAREHGTFFVGAGARSAFLLHGTGYKPQLMPLEDSWRLDLGTGAWSPWRPAGDAVVPAGSRRAATTPDGKTAYVFGGYAGYDTTATDLSELYRVDLGAAEPVFTKIDVPASAAPRELHAVAYDAVAEQLVVFGGYSSSVYDDVVLVSVSGNKAAFRMLAVTGKRPSARYGFFYAFDAPSRRLVVWSGGQDSESDADPVHAAEDVWALELGAEPVRWTKLEPSGKAPPGRRNGCIMHDPVGRRLFVHGGTSDARSSQPGLFALALEPGHEGWTRVERPGEPLPRSSGFGFALPDGSVACGFGNDKKLFTDLNVLGYAD